MQRAGHANVWTGAAEDRMEKGAIGVVRGDALSNGGCAHAKAVGALWGEIHEFARVLTGDPMYFHAKAPTANTAFRARSRQAVLGSTRSGAALLAETAIKSDSSDFSKGERNQGDPRRELT